MFLQDFAASVRSVSQAPEGAIHAMTQKIRILPLALLGALAMPAAHAEVAIDVIGGSVVSFDGLLQSDA